eukprot:6212037-Pleurochrysis_carterae.AAC.3
MYLELCDWYTCSSWLLLLAIWRILPPTIVVSDIEFRCPASYCVCGQLSQKELTAARLQAPNMCAHHVHIYLATKKITQTQALACASAGNCTRMLTYLSAQGHACERSCTHTRMQQTPARRRRLGS